MIKTNREFAKTDPAFLAACKLVPTGRVDENDNAVTLPPTIRQASKFRRRKGSAYKAMIKAWR